MWRGTAAVVESHASYDLLTPPLLLSCLVPSSLCPPARPGLPPWPLLPGPAPLALFEPFHCPPAFDYWSYSRPLLNVGALPSLSLLISPCVLSVRTRCLRSPCLLPARLPACPPCIVSSSCNCNLCNTSVPVSLTRIIQFHRFQAVQGKMRTAWCRAVRAGRRRGCAG